MRTYRVITRERGDQQSRNAWKNRWRTVDYAPRVQRRFEPRRFSAGLIAPRWRGTAVASTPVRLVLCHAAAKHRRVFSCAPRGGHQFMQQQSYASVIGILAGALLALQGAAHAQSATIDGSIGN